MENPTPDGRMVMDPPPSNFAPGGFGQPEPKKSNTGLIVAIIVVLLLCCCCVGTICGWWLWNNGDSLIDTTLLLRNL